MYVSGKFGALRPRGRRFESQSSRHVATLEKAFTQLPVALRRVNSDTVLEPCADVIVSAARQSILVGGGAPQVQEIGDGAGGQKTFSHRFPKIFRSILKINFLVT